MRGLTLPRLAGPVDLGPSEQMVYLHTVIRERAGERPTDLAGRRAGTVALWGGLPLPAGVTRSPQTVGGVACVRVTMGTPRRDAVVVWLHGGAYTLGTAAASAPAAGHLAAATGLPVVVVDYRLAPATPSRPRWTTRRPSTGRCSASSRRPGSPLWASRPVAAWRWR